MISYLHIENYVLIEQLDLTFESGFSVITGETGAGKSVLMGAIGLILGQRADLKVIKDDSRKCVLEAGFLQTEALKSYFEDNDLEYDPSLCVIRRELYANGKSRAFVNDSPVSLAQLKEVGKRLVDVHSQHENLLLGNDGFQLDMVDTLARSTDLLEDYQMSFRQFHKLEKDLLDLEENLRKSREEKDYLAFQFQQLSDAKLQAGEQEELENEQEMLSHTEDIKNCLALMDQLLNDDEGGICKRLKSASQAAQRSAGHFASLEEARERLDSCLIELQELSRDINRWDNGIEMNPQRLEEVGERLSLLYELQKKHRVQTPEELIALRDGLEDRLQQIDKGDDKLDELRRQSEEAKNEAQKKADALSRKRRSVFAQIERNLIALLKPLGMPNVSFEIGHGLKEMDMSGIDRICFRFSANKNIPVQDVSQIASGGEVSRLMLCLKSLVADKEECSSLLFDEIDTGVSGEIAHKMAVLMEQIARNRQVICITHLPQIAARGARHYKVYKTEDGQQAISQAKLLSREERIVEIAQMVGGATLSDAALNNAIQLLDEQ